MPFRSFRRWMSPLPRVSTAARLRMEVLEGREVPTVSLAGIANTDQPNNKPLFIPVTATNTPNGPVTITAKSDNSSVTTEVVAGGRSVKLDVSGTDATGAAFTGSLTIRLFEDVAPLATGTIIQLANEGFYNGKLFHRVLPGFVIQGGSPNGDGQGGSSKPDVVDEFNSQYTFASNGIVAMANAGDDNNNSQFFISDTDLALAARPQSLNFNHSIVGLLTSGFETYKKIINTTTKVSPGGEKSLPVNPVTITKATVFTDTANGVVKVSSAAGFIGDAGITIGATDGDNTPTATTFRTNLVADAVNDRAFLNKIADVRTNPGTPVTFTARGTDLDSDQLTYAVGSATSLFTAPTNVTAAIDQNTGLVTLTPAAGFSGTIDLLVGVRDQTIRSGSSLDTAGNFDTQLVRLTVRAPGETVTTLSVSKLNPGIGRTVLLSASVAGDPGILGAVKFFANGVELGSSRLLEGRALLTTSFAAVSTQTVTAQFVPDNTGSTTSTSTAAAVTVVAGTAPVSIRASSIDFGQSPTLAVTNADGSARFTLNPFEATFTGGVRVAVADVNGDGQDDIITVPGFGGAPIIKIFSGTDGTLISQKMIFEDTFRGGLYVDAGDSAQLGYAQILVGAGFNGGPRVNLYDAVRDISLLNYFAYDPNFRGGVAVDMSDLRGGLQQNIVTSPGKGGGPQVNVYDGLPLSTSAVPTKRGTFTAGADASTDGLRVGADVLSTGANPRRAILVGPFASETAPLTTSFDPFEKGVFS